MPDCAWIYHPIRSKQWLPNCCVCKEPVFLERSKTDEYGQAVHEECYVLRVRSKAGFSTTLGLCRTQQTSVPVTGLTTPPWQRYEICRAAMSDASIATLPITPKAKSSCCSRSNPSYATDATPSPRQILSNRITTALTRA
jgi:hypothetical protein